MGDHRHHDVRRRDLPGIRLGVKITENNARPHRASTAAPRTPSSPRSAPRSSAATTTCRSTSCSWSPRSSWSSPPTPRSTASPCWPRSWPRTATCRGRCTPAATGWCSATASCCWRCSPALLICAFHAQSTKLIQLYIVGVFVSFTLQPGGHGPALEPAAAARPTDRAAGAPTHRRRAISAFAFVITGTVLVIVLVTKFLSGAWIAIVAMVVIWFLMQGIHRHYGPVSEEIVVDEDEPTTLPSRVHSIVLVSKLHQPDAAGAGVRPRDPAVHPRGGDGRVDPDEARTPRGGVGAAEDPGAAEGAGLARSGRSPGRSSTTCGSCAATTRATCVTVFVPEYVVGKWWEQLLHNQSALRLLARLRFTPGVVVTSVPYLLESGREASAAARATRPSAATSPWSTCSAAPRPMPRAAGDRADRRRRPVARASASRPTMTGPATVELEVGPVAHGGHCVARHEGQVVFVRHALPGERVLAHVTDGGPGVAVPAGRRGRGRSSPSPHRVAAPCPHARPGGCGGCDFQHADAAAPARAEGGGRPRAAAPAGRPGRGPAGRGPRRRAGAGRHRRPGLADPGPVRGRRRRPGRAAPAPFARRRSRCDDVPASLHPVAAGHRRAATGAGPGAPRSPVAGSVATRRRPWSLRRRRGLRSVRGCGGGRRAPVAGGRRRLLAGAPRGGGRAARRGARPRWRRARASTCSTSTPGWACSPARWRRPGRGRSGRRRRGGRHGRARRPPQPARPAVVRLHAGPASSAGSRGRASRRCDLVVLDPPRAGAGRHVVEELVRLAPRAVAYVACDPASLARDVGMLPGPGWALAGLRAYDLFPMTHHVECVARCCTRPAQDVLTSRYSGTR